jgi:biopolymer transport protein ExbD
MLVLLVIFIITAPLFQQAVPIDLPKVDSSKVEDKPKVVSLALDAAGTVFIDGARIDAAEVDAALRAAAGNAAPAPELHLRADRGTRYERVAELMAQAPARRHRPHRLRHRPAGLLRGCSQNKQAVLCWCPFEAHEATSDERGHTRQTWA